MLKNSRVGNYSAAYHRLLGFLANAHIWWKVAEEKGFSNHRKQQVLKVQDRLMAKAERLMYRDNGIPSRNLSFHSNGKRKTYD